MSLVYISDPKSVLSISGNRLNIKVSDAAIRTIPIELFAGITLLGPAQLTSQCMEICMKKGIPVSFLSKGGKYFGRLMSSGHIKPELQRHQSALYDTPFAVELARKICSAKIKNQLTVVRRYRKASDGELNSEIFAMKNSVKKLRLVRRFLTLLDTRGAQREVIFQRLPNA